MDGLTKTVMMNTLEKINRESPGHEVIPISDGLLFTNSERNNHLTEKLGQFCNTDMLEFLRGYLCALEENLCK